MPRHKRKLTEEQIESCRRMAALRMPHEYMASILGIPRDTFEKMIKSIKPLRKAILEGRASAHQNVRITLYQKAMGKPAVKDLNGNVIEPEIPGDFQALRFWSETQEGFKKTERIEIPGLTEEDTAGIPDGDLDSRAMKVMERLQKRIASKKGKTNC